MPTANLRAQASCHLLFATGLFLATAGCTQSPAESSRPTVQPYDPTPSLMSSFSEFNRKQITDLQVKGHSIQCIFDGTVTDIRTIYDGYDGEVVSTDHPDARWIVVIGKIKVRQGTLPSVVDDGRYALLVHSPAQFFALSGAPDSGRDCVNSRFRFACLADNLLIPQYMGKY